MISAVPSVSSVHVELDGRLPSTAGRTDETTKSLNRCDLVYFNPMVYGSQNATESVHHFIDKFIYSRIKKKAEAKGKKCHAKTMWSLEKPI